ncbi:MAG: hypothetical protein R3C69_12845 [Geminicoccaceae bacterium]
MARAGHDHSSDRLLMRSSRSKALTLDLPTPLGTLRLLDGIDLALDAGDWHGIVGESGCGKSLTASRSCASCRIAPGSAAASSSMAETSWASTSRRSVGCAVRRSA